MKKLTLAMSMLVLTLMTACSEGPSKDGENQLPQPAQNSGPATEAQRAVEAVKDSIHMEASDKIDTTAHSAHP